MNKSNLFRSAWQLAKSASAKFGSNAKSYFAQSLKLAHRIEKMKSLGGSEWVRGDMHRIYFNLGSLSDLIGFNYSTYKTGNISSANISGESMSNSAAEKLRSALDNSKFHYDIVGGKFSSYGLGDWFGIIINAINK